MKLPLVKLPLAVIALFTLAGSAAYAANNIGSCLTQPPINPNKDFIGNFNNPCYAVTMTEGGGTNESGDSNAIYNQLFYAVTPGYSLVIVGTFPNARFTTATVYDQHLAVTSRLIDYQILPMYPGMVNPFVTGVPYQPNQTYGLAVSFGGGSPTNVSPGCSTSDTTIDENMLDASQIHQGLTWSGYPNLPSDFPPHQTGANSTGLITIRKYMDISSSPTDVVIVRQLSNGCAIPASEAKRLGILNTFQPTGFRQLNDQQIHYHNEFAETVEPKLCFPPDPSNAVIWYRTSDYIPIDNAGAYIHARIPSSQLKSLQSGQTFLRLQFRLPTVPNTPCTTGDCALTGNEQLRYESIAFIGKATRHAAKTITAIADNNFVKDPDGNVTVIASFGATPPPNVTAANYYTYVDLTKALNFKEITQLTMRNLFPNPSYQCSAWNIPYFTTEYNPEGGYMGPYVPTVDFPTAAEIPVKPVPPSRPMSCSLVPTQTPVACTIN